MIPYKRLKIEKKHEKSMLHHAEDASAISVQTTRMEMGKQEKWKYHALTVTTAGIMMEIPKREIIKDSNADPLK